MDTGQMREALLSTLAEVEERQRNAETELKQTKEQLAEANAEIARVKDENARVAAAEEEKHAREVDARSREVAMLDGKIGAARTTLAGLEALVRSKQDLHDQVEASLNSLRQRIG